MPRSVSRLVPAWLVWWSKRLGALWAYKLVGFSAGIPAFFVAYFWLLRNPRDTPTIMPLTAIDRAIPFQPATAGLYLSLWVYITVWPFLLTQRRALAAYGIATSVLAVVGLGCFYLWPTAVAPSQVTWPAHSPLGFLKTIDASGNACPSLHVAFAVFTGFGFDRFLAALGAGRIVRGLNWLWAAGIVYSTLATRQHVALDAAAGIALGGSIAQLLERECPARGAAA